MPNTNEDLSMSAQMTKDLSLHHVNDQFSNENRLFNAEEWLEEKYPQNGVCQIDDWYKNKGKKRSEITRLDVVQQNLAGILDVSSFLNLTELYCWNNKLTSLILPKKNQLIKIIVYNNYLTTFNYAFCNPLTLKELRIENNNLAATDLEVFSHLVNLNFLYIDNDDYWIKENKGNQFTGSFASFQKLTKLTDLYILNLSLQLDFEYLPTSLQDIICTGQIDKELRFYGNNLQLWQVYHPYLMKRENKAVVHLTDYQLETKKQISVDSSWFEGRETQQKYLLRSNQASFNYSQQLTYSGFLVKDFHSFNWECCTHKNKFSRKFKKSLKLKKIFNSFRKKSPQKSLPLRLYNLAANQVINSKDEQNLNNYLLSYCWGAEWENTPQSYGQSYQTDLTKLGRKALNKVQSTYQFLKDQHNLNTDHIWIDNFCINHTDPVEKEQEIAQQRNYYSNAIATFIAIDAKVLDTFPLDNGEIGNDFALGNAKIGIVDQSNASLENGVSLESNQDKFMKHLAQKIFHSDWFTRAWTFQEGILSKQTIFMFDDVLVDGRRLALYWGGKQGTYNKKPCTFITPFGWSAGNQNVSSSIGENHEYDLSLEQNSSLSLEKTEKIAYLNLGEALFAVTHRKQTVLLDKIYSILGPLSYGDKIKVEYRNDFTFEKVKNFSKSNIDFEDLENKLVELINQAYSHNHYEVITYLGERNHNHWWLPTINATGAWQIEGSLNYDERSDQHYLNQIEQITKQGIQLKGHWIIKDEQNIVEIDRSDYQDNALWPSTLQFILNAKTKAITIKQVEEEECYYLHGKQPTDLFIDMINFKVIEGEIKIKEYLQSLETRNESLDEDLVTKVEQLEISNYL